MNCFLLAMKNPEGAINGRIPIGLLLLSAILGCQALSAEPLTDSEARGKQFYLTGIPPSGKPVKAMVGPESTELSGSEVPCFGCHGEDGKGRPEGGIVPTDITFEYLSLPYGHNHDNGRKHGAFTAETILMAVTGGIDPSGNRLDSAMPRYTLSAGDSADLIAYLKRLSSDADPGLTETTIRLGTLLPTRGPLADIGLAMKDMLSAYFDELNVQGGIYNRKIRLEVAEFTGDADSTAKNLRRLLEDEPIFALIAPFAPNLEQDILLLSMSRDVPQIGPYTLFPENDPIRSRATFYLRPGLNDEAAAMVDYAADRLHLKNPTARVIAPADNHFQKAAEVIEKQSLIRDLGPIALLAYPPHQFEGRSIAAELEKQPPEVIYFFGSDDELRMLLKSLKGFKPQPYVFCSGALTGTTVFNEAFYNPIFLSVLSPPNDPKNTNEFFRLIKRHRLMMHHLPAQALAYSAAKLLAEGLQRTGRKLSRKKLITTLEQIARFDTGLMSTLSFGPGQHLGSRKVRIISATAKDNRFIKR
ncbi:MAG: ABC transporter substrate-binding protein [Methylomicrobium sp.]